MIGDYHTRNWKLGGFRSRMKDGRTLAREAIAMGKENSSNQCHMVVGIAPEKQKFWGRDHGKTKHALSM